MTTGSKVRDEWITRAIRETVACNEPPQQIGFVRDKLPADFDLGDDELAAALKELGLTRADVPPAVAEVGDPPEAGASAVPDVPPISREQARAAVEAAHKRLGEARVAVQIAKQKAGDAKGALATAITAWQTNVDPMSAEQRRAQELRNHIAGEQARKAAAAARGAPTTRMRTDKFPAQNMVTGQMGHKGNSRGAYPREFQHRTIKQQPGAKA